MTYTLTLIEPGGSRVVTYTARETWNHDPKLNRFHATLTSGNFTVVYPSPSMTVEITEDPNDAVQESGPQ